MPKLKHLASTGWLDVPTPQVADVVAGGSVALVVIPQSLAYAQIAGLPLHVGLFAAALPAIVFSLFASSPFLQTGPVAMTSLLTFGALSGAGFDPADGRYVLAAALLAVMVGVMRFALGVAKLGWVAYLISDPVLIGFTAGAALVIMASQFPKAVGASGQVPKEGTIEDAVWVAVNPGAWSLSAVGLTLLTMALMSGGAKVHRLFPGVLLAVFTGLAATRWFGYEGPTVGMPVPGGAGVAIPEGLPALSLDLPWSDSPGLLLGAVVIALVGFAEPSAIARAFANEDQTTWNASRELISSGFANVASGASGGYPIGGSFSRSSINRLAGARTRWSGGVTGLIVLGFLGFASILEQLPLAVLGGIVLAAVYRLLKPRTLWRMWRRSRIKAALAWLTFGVTVWATPNVHWAVVLGVCLSLAFHFGRPFSIQSTETQSSELERAKTPIGLGRPLPAGAHHGTETLVLKPVGLLWFAAQRSFREQLLHAACETDSTEILLDLGDLVALEVTTIEAITDMAVAVAPRRVRVTRGPLNARVKIEQAINRALHDSPPALR